MLRSYFRRVRMQPKGVRDRHALIIAVSFTCLVASVWIFTQLNLDTEDRRQVASETALPFSNLIDQVKDEWAAVRKSLPDEATGAPAVATTSTGVESPTTLRLSEDNLTALREQGGGADSVETATETTKQLPYREVQIVTVSASGTASGTNETMEPR